MRETSAGLSIRGIAYQAWNLGSDSEGQRKWLQVLRCHFGVTLMRISDCGEVKFHPTMRPFVYFSDSAYSM